MRAGSEGCEGRKRRRDVKEGNTVEEGEGFGLFAYAEREGREGRK